MWLSYLKRTWPQAAELHAAIRRLHDSREILEVIERAPADRPGCTRRISARSLVCSIRRRLAA